MKSLQVWPWVNWQPRPLDPFYTPQSMLVPCQVPKDPWMHWKYQIRLGPPEAVRIVANWVTIFIACVHCRFLSKMLLTQASVLAASNALYARLEVNSQNEPCSCQRAKILSLCCFWCSYLLSLFGKKISFLRKPVYNLFNREWIVYHLFYIGNGNILGISAEQRINADIGSTQCRSDTF